MEFLLQGLQAAASQRQNTYQSNEHVHLDRNLSSVLNEQVTEIYYHAAKTQIGVNPPVTIPHYRIYLVLSNGQSSVEIDSARRQQSYTQLNVTYRAGYKYSTSQNYIGAWAVGVQRRFTVHEFLSLIVDQKHRERYQLHPQSGSGCRYWCTTVLGDLAHVGWVRRDAATVGHAAATQIPTLAPSIHVPALVAGTFY